MDDSPRVIRTLATAPCTSAPPTAIPFQMKTDAEKPPGGKSHLDLRNERKSREGGRGALGAGWAGEKVTWARESDAPAPSGSDSARGEDGRSKPEPLSVVSSGLSLLHQTASTDVMLVVDEAEPLIEVTLIDGAPATGVVEKTGGFTEGENLHTSILSTDLHSTIDSDNPWSPLAALGDKEWRDGDIPAIYGRRKRRVYDREIPGHARFLQYLFRRIVALRPGGWRRGGLHRLPILYRPPCVYGCRNGLALASKDEMAAQAMRSSKVVEWYENYVRIHRRMHSGKTPSALVSYCGEGGVSEGIRRAGGAAHGQDLREQLKYVRRFGQECFSRGDSRNPKGLRALRRSVKSFVTFASPPCKAHSTAQMRGKPSEPPMIAETRSALQEMGGLYAIENVTGAGSELRGATLLRGAYFGLGVDRPRLFESNFEIHVDEALKGGGDALRRRTCLGHRRRWRRLDPFGRPDLHDCCAGNLWAVQGDKLYRCTHDECSVAMGLDPDHMSYAGMTQAIPPVYARLLFAQACMRDLENEFGIVPLTYDEMSENPDRCRRQMAFWLRGAGGASPEQGVEFAGATGDTPPTSAPCGKVSAPIVPAEGVAPAYAPVHSGTHDGGESAPADPRTVRDAELRELEYAWAGFFDRAVIPAGDVPSAELMGWAVETTILEGGNTLWCGPSRDLMRTASHAADLCRSHPGTRVTLEARGARDEAFLKARGGTLVRRIGRGAPRYADAEAAARSPHPSSFWALGEEVTEGGRVVDYDALEAAMDPLDRTGAPQEPKSAKLARSYAPIDHRPARWDIGLPEELNDMMAGEGVGIHVWDEPGFSEVPFYPFKSNVGLARSIFEADRAIAAGAMEYVPLGSIEEVRRASTIHPWTIVDQGSGKWRLCHDYSVGTNRIVATAPFSLPSVWDVLPTVGSDTHFAKYDIRDGFWHCPVSRGSRKRLMVRHPGTGRLLWASALPFGYLDSPRLFCGLTEALIERLRSQAAAEGTKVRFYVFVDDVLVVGADERATKRGMELLEAEFDQRGVQIAPNKTRGPCRCIEFLGLLLANTEEYCGVTLTRKRRDKLAIELSDWLGREPREGSLVAEPKAVASLLGKLVFASQVIPGGRTYMQGMLAAFKGVVVDWRRGTVSFGGKAGQELTLRPGFWRDVRWWVNHLHTHSFTTTDKDTSRGELVLAGTDASDWGTGQVIWRDGGREEYQLEFTRAERRRPNE